MEIRHLRYFVAVAEELHFGKAAKRLLISQPPLSQQIMQLEDELEVVLFYRDNRNVELTEAGKAFYEKSIEILNLINFSCKEAQSIGKGEIGEITLGFTGSVTYELLPSIINICQKRLPNVKLELTQLTTAEQIKALEKRKIHIGLLISPIENSFLNSFVVSTEEFLVCLPENHYLAEKENPIDPKELENEKFILSPPEAGQGYYDSFYQIFEDAGFEPMVVQVVKEQLTMVSLVAAGLGIVIVPESTQNIKISGVVFKRLSKSYNKKTSVAWNKDTKQPGTLALLKLIQEVVNSKTEAL